MEQLNILLCCGAGMSSGFLAQQMRSSAKKRKLMATISAKSQNDIEDQLSEADILLLGPHLLYLKEDMESKCAPYQIPVRVIDKDIYGSLNGEALLDQVLEILKKED